MSDAAGTTESPGASSPNAGAGDGPAGGQANGGSGAGQPPRPAAPSGPTAVQLALEAGWTMAVLYGRIESVPPDRLPGLPTANELQAAVRRKLELDRLRHLLKSLAQMPEFSDSGLSDVVPPGLEAQPEALPVAAVKLTSAAHPRSSHRLQPTAPG